METKAIPQKFVRNFDKTLYSEITRMRVSDEDFIFEFCTRIEDILSVDTRIAVSIEHAERISKKIKDLIKIRKDKIKK